MTTDKKQTGAYFDEITLERVRKAARIEGRSISNFIQWSCAKTTNEILGKSYEE